MTDLDLDATKARVDGYDLMTDADIIFDEPKFYRAYAARAHNLARDVPALLAEVERLRLSQAAAKVQLKERQADYSKTLKEVTDQLAESDADRKRLGILVEILSADQPDGEEYYAAEQELMVAWPDLAKDRVYVEQLVQVVLNKAWSVNHPRRTKHLDADRFIANAVKDATVVVQCDDPDHGIADREIERLNAEVMRVWGRVRTLQAQRDTVLARLDSLDELGRVVSANCAPYVTVTSCSSDDLRAIYATPDLDACPACTGSLDTHGPDCVATRLKAEVDAMVPELTPEVLAAGLAKVLATPRDGGTTRYRVGRSVGRTLYEDGKLFGLVDTAEQAHRIVAALNSQPAPTNSQTWEQAIDLIVHQSWDSDEIGWGEDAHGIWLDLDAAKAATLSGYIDWYMDYEFSGDDEEADQCRADLSAELHWKQAHSSWELHGEPVTADRSHASWRGVLITSEKVIVADSAAAVNALGPADGTEASDA